MIQLGTTEVLGYKRPGWLFHKVAFLEKEDHLRILGQARWDSRHDCALVSSNGFSTRAARDLIDHLAEQAERNDEPLTVFCLHDADASGSMIAQTLQEATRARGSRRIKIIDLGLYPWRAIEMGLPVEDVSYDRRQPVSDYVRKQPGEWDNWLQEHRIELNAMTPAKLIAFLDVEVERHGKPKVVPPEKVAVDDLRKSLHSLVEKRERERVMRRAERSIQRRVAAQLEKLAAKIPAGDTLAKRIEKAVTNKRELHWRKIVEDIAGRLAFGRRWAP